LKLDGHAKVLELNTNESTHKEGLKLHLVTLSQGSKKQIFNLLKPAAGNEFMISSKDATNTEVFVNPIKDNTAFKVLTGKKFSGTIADIPKQDPNVLQTLWKADIDRYRTSITDTDKAIKSVAEANANADYYERQRQTNEANRKETAVNKTHFLDSVSFNFFTWDDVKKTENTYPVSLSWKPRISMIGYVDNTAIKFNGDQHEMKFNICMGETCSVLDKVQLEEKTRIRVDFRKNKIDQIKPPQLYDLGKQKSIDKKLQEMCENKVLQVKNTSWLTTRGYQTCKSANGCNPWTKDLDDKVPPKDSDMGLCYAKEHNDEPAPDPETHPNVKRPDTAEKLPDPVGHMKKITRPAAPLKFYSIDYDFLINTVKLADGECRDREKPEHVKN